MNFNLKMRKKGLLLIFCLLTLVHIGWTNPVKNITPKNFITTVTSNGITFDSYASDFYVNLQSEALSYDAFKIALKGFLTLKKNNKLENTKYLTVADFSKHSKEERLFIIDTESQQVVHKSLVAHGRNSGFEFAKNFSNKPNSHKSSIGFYKTAETYNGKHGYSLRLDGLEYSNSNARKRAVVIHSADYAGKDFVKRNGRLGRSYGCPSLPKKDYKQVISKIKEGSCLFIYYPQQYYLSKSKLANANVDVNQNA